MSEKRKEEINPYAALGVSDARANEMSTELHTLESEVRSIDEVLTALAERYDSESLVMGLFLAMLVMRDDGRLLPPGARYIPIKSALN